MNWLMYIGGGLLFLDIIARILSRSSTSTPANISWTSWKGDRKEIRLALVYGLLVWIWICWRFIK